MKKLHGIGTSDGVAIGRLMLYQNDKLSIEKHYIENTENELARFKAAQKQAEGALNEIYLKLLKQVGEKDSMIFQIHIMMLQDEDFTEAIQEKIVKEQVNAEFAVWETGQEFAEQFAQMDSEYMRGRKTDVIDISRRLIQCLNKSTAAGPVNSEEPFILAAEDLTPSETVKLDQSKVLAIVTRVGSRTSHSAILSRTMGIPAVAGLEDSFEKLKDGMFVIVDGTSGEVLLEPDKATQENYEKRQTESINSKNKLKQSLGNTTIMHNGRTIEVNANIGHPGDVQSALENGADGIGLFRSEFLYMGRDSLPTEDEQFEAYRQVLKKMGKKPVIVRTFDIGADKKVPYLHLPEEENPALGYRAIRICLDQTDLFRTQLRALLRASAFGNLKIMFPMIISTEEIRTAKAILEDIKSDLSAKNIAFDTAVKVGIMIETPAAAVLSSELAKECDFFSIGTNDLTQYTLAADRMNGKISKLYNQRNPAVLKMIEMAAQSAHQAGIPVGICGESAADPALTEFYLKLGIDELSVVSPSVLSLKSALQQAIQSESGKD
ncbi:MAG TPA: phosphoenolpyruvate--protein phosphotransferase [Clostridiales bacterium]|nr:phosphoenolpyruvate--protein phosphotransferase [Clostridiales bacterium]